MRNTRVLIGLLLVLIVLFVGYVLVTQTQDTSDNGDQDDTQHSELPPSVSAEIIGDITYTIEDSQHEIGMTVQLPTPCHVVNQDVEIMESAPEQVRIALTVPADDGVCIQVIDEREVTIAFEASAEAQVSAILHGEEITLPEPVISDAS